MIFCTALHWYQVAIASRRLPVLEAAAAEITQQTGGRVLPLQLDIRDPAAVKQAVDTVEAELGLPTVCIRCHIRTVHCSMSSVFFRW